MIPPQLVPTPFLRLAHSTFLLKSPALTFLNPLSSATTRFLLSKSSLPFFFFSPFQPLPPNCYIFFYPISQRPLWSVLPPTSFFSSQLPPTLLLQPPLWQGGHIHYYVSHGSSPRSRPPHSNNKLPALPGVVKKKFWSIKGSTWYIFFLKLVLIFIYWRLTKWKILQLTNLN